mmetsp:Transcript_55660/g.118546  ORF Transcript_55660/g.118546 Transcript_55660/m.118546 type:complete len:323 (+) Transcript_55660:119-1087(+)
MTSQLLTTNEDWMGGVSSSSIGDAGVSVSQLGLAAGLLAYSLQIHFKTIGALSYALFACFFVACADMVCQQRLPWEAEAIAQSIPTVALLQLSLHRLDVLPEIPLSDMVPWWSFLMILILAACGGEYRDALGFSAGIIDGDPLMWFWICVVVSTLVLVAWSRLWVKGKHGSIQKELADILTPKLLIVAAAANAFGEELDARVLHLGGLLAGSASSFPYRYEWFVLANTCHATFFAMQHVAAGFPSGISGGLMVFSWAIFLGILRWWTGGMLLVLVLHFQADVVIFALILYEKKARIQRRNGRCRAKALVEQEPLLQTEPLLQ